MRRRTSPLASRWVHCVSIARTVRSKKDSHRLTCLTCHAWLSWDREAAIRNLAYCVFFSCCTAAFLFPLLAMCCAARQSC